MTAGVPVSIRRLWSGSIGRRLAFGVGALMALAMGFFVYQTVERQHEFFERQAEQLSMALAATLASNAVSRVIANDAAGLSEVVASVKNYPELGYAEVMSPDGRALAHADGKFAGRYTVDDLRRSILEGPKTPRLVARDSKFLHAAAPVMSDGALIGWARVGLGHPEDSIRDTTWRGIEFGVIAVILGAALGALTGREMTAGLKRLVDTARKIGAGQSHARSGVIREDELGVLGSAFDAMADALENTNRELKENERNFRELLANLPTGVVVHGPSGAIAYANEAAQQIFGPQRGFGPQRPVVEWRFIRENGSPLPTREWPINRVLTSRQPLRNCMVGVVSNARPSPSWLQGALYPELDAQGQVKRVIAAFVDITEHRKAEQTLRLALQIGHTGAFESDLETGHGAWTPEVAEIWGMPEDFDGDFNAYCMRHVHPDDLAHVESEIREMTRTLSDGELEFRIIRPDGVMRWVRMRARVLDDASAGPRRLAGVIMDITEGRQAEEALRASEMNYHSLVAAMAEGVMLEDASGVMAAVNPAAQLILEKCISPDAALSGEASLSTAVREDGTPFPPDEQPGKVTLVTGEPQSNVLMGLPQRDGEMTWLSVNSHPLIFEHESRPHAAVITFHDITGIKKAENEILKLNAELEQRVEQRTAALELASKELETFAYSVSHDLRPPLRAVDGFSRILLDEYHGCLDHNAQRYLNLVRANTGRMGKLIDDLLMFFSTARHEIGSENIDMRALAQNVFEDVRSAVSHRNIDFQLGSLPPAKGDREMVRRVLTNLLGNAVKFTARIHDATIEVGGRVEGSKGVYWVKDNGAGFDPRFANKLFGVFQRLHSNEEFEGTGIGLAIVKRIIDRHGGRVWAESEVGRGTTVYFTLDARPQPV